MIKEISYNEIPKSIYSRGFVLTFPPRSSKDIFFLVDEDVEWVLKEYQTVADYIQIEGNAKCPRGINMIKPLDKDGKYLLVAYSNKVINKREVASFVQLIFSKK